MKFPFFKTIFVASAIFALTNCTEENLSGSPDDKNPQALVVDQASWILPLNDQQYTIGIDGSVKDADGVLAGMMDFATGTITSIDQTTVIAQGIDITILQVVTPPVVNSLAWILAADQIYVIYPAESGAVDANGNSIGIVTDSEGNQIGMFIYDPTTFSGTIVGMDTVTPLVSGVDATTLQVYQPNVQQPDVSSSSMNTSSASVQPKSSANNPTSSASAPKSSSSITPVSSSSQAAAGFTIKYINGGKSGSGYATRYWDCCKPHCAWPEHGGTASTCDASGNKVDKSATSMCVGGNAGICRGQFPIVYNDTLAFAFAATPNGENNCGKCFDLVFTGEGKYANDNNLKKLKGKHLIVMSSNVGNDVAGGQFDIMIPGGGYGLFNGCGSKMGWGSQGSQYGGLLDECEKETNYTASKYKSCLTQKCNASFASDPKAKEGCLFLANWMNAAGNPLHNYKEVECPKQLKEVY